jgi:hypothetical protein
VDDVDYADLVTVAVLQSVANTNHPYAKLDWSTIGAFDRVGVSPEMEMAEAVDLDLDEGEDITGLLS